MVFKRTSPAVLLAVAIACTAAPKPPATVAQLPDINAAAVLADITKLASDEFQGRAPGSDGERITVQYLTDQFKAAGLEPGNPDGTWTQKVPLVGLSPSPSPLVVKKGGRSKTFKLRDDFVAFSKHVVDQVSVANSEMIFVGYGVQAPEYQWDDFRGIDVKGKTIVVLVNDPPVTTASGEIDANTFGGKAMTYYGRWTYKFEKAAELGAAAVFIVHETIPAGYPYTVVQGMGGQRFNLVTPDKNMSRSVVEGWMSMEAATELFKMAGQDYQALKKLAATREFKPVALGATASITVGQTMRTIDSQNVVAKITGSDSVLKDEYVIYTAHWDHFGVGVAVEGDAIYNGAQDNASGTAAMLEVARAFKKITPGPKRTIVFLAVTAEEQGLLGSQYYAEFPLYPLNRTLANLNMDGMNLWGKTKDITVVGLGASDLDDYVAAAAKEQGRVVNPDPEPEKGFYYRSDHFNFAKKGVPSLHKDDGLDYVGKPAGFGQQKRDEYNKTFYHAPSDDVKPGWDLAGLAEDGKLLLAVGYRIAQANTYPEWKPGNEFRAIREKMLK